ncbi:helix-turn-helix transcriptional regulator [Niallia circulans]|uniref:helix-turn-helix domain-containing protein n=1 Tax=Niallia circulans TaxID=1397 RepID=UPI00148FA36A|nr:helix-turn-helix transcriptional regulator [Niallia circulans]QJX63019.1 helix-turn-helix transcriptional regulator [Niallia circulans]
MNRVFQISLAAARVNAGLKQMEAAKELGITEKTLGGYERGQTAIPGHVLQKAAKLYDIPSDLIRLPNVNDGKHDDEFFFK